MSTNDTKSMRSYNYYRPTFHPNHPLHPNNISNLSTTTKYSEQAPNDTQQRNSPTSTTLPTTSNTTTTTIAIQPDYHPNIINHDKTNRMTNQPRSSPPYVTNISYRPNYHPNHPFYQQHMNRHNNTTNNHQPESTTAENLDSNETDNYACINYHPFFSINNAHRPPDPGSISQTPQPIPQPIDHHQTTQQQNINRQQNNEPTEQTTDDNNIITNNQATQLQTDEQARKEKGSAKAPERNLMTEPNDPDEINENYQLSNRKLHQIQTRMTYNDDHNMSVGDILSESKNPDHLRIYFQNIHGISKNQWLDWNHAGEQIRKLQIDVIGAAETNILWTESLRRNAQYQIKQSTKTQAHLAVASSIDAGTTNYQPGGTATGIFGKWTGRVITTTNDTSGMGRWSGFMLNTKNNMKLVIITVYIPCKTDGNNTTYQQQWRILRNKHGGDPDPRKHLLTDLEKEIRKWTQASYEIIMMVDSNENITECNSKILPFLARTKLTPLHNTFPDASYDRGSKCIDFIFATEMIKTATIKGGYTSFYEGIWTSDHRGIFVDISTKYIFHGETPELQQTQNRNLSSKNKSQVDRFIKHLDKKNRIPDLLQRITILNRIEAPWTSVEYQLLENIDKEFTNILLKAEEKCALPHNAGWHPELHQCYLIQQYWRIRKSGQANRKDITYQLQAISHQLEPETDIYQQDPNRSTSRQLSIATTNVRKQRRLAMKKRAEFLTYRKEIQVLEGKQDKATAIATIQRAERRAQTFRKYHVYTKPPRTNGGISHVITENNGIRTRIQDKDQLEHELYERNRAHFAQAARTPFAESYLQEVLNHSGVSELTDTILRGEELPEEMNKTAKELLRELKAVRAPISHEMSFASMLRGFGKWREATTTSPSTKHLGIYKSLVQYHQLAERQKVKPTLSETMSQVATEALQIQHLLINLAIKHTHTYERWKVIHNFFIEKIPGVPLINKLRVIHLYEADWNLILKFFLSYKLTHLACKERTVTREQAGGRLGRSASDMATKTVITHEVCRLQRLNCAIIYNDAKACFDRVIESFSNLTCMREGLPKKIAELHAQTLSKAKYFIKTSHGIASKANGHMAPDPFFGTGQGAGDSMARWGFVSDAIIRAYNKQAKSAPIQSPISHRQTVEHIQAFVDDTHGTMINESTSDDMILEMIRHNMQAWENILYASGGKLELSKCKFCILQWQPNADGNYSIQPSQCNEINVTDSETDEIATTSALLPNQAYKLLGIMMALDGNCKAQTEHFAQKCNKLATAFNQLQLTQAEALQGYRSIFLPAARYGLSATNIPWNTMTSIQRTITNAILPSLGYNRHTARPIVFAPEHFGGIGLYNLAVEQGIAHITFLVGHIRANTEVSRTLFNLLESYMIQTGSITSPLIEYQQFPYVQAPWMDTLRAFLKYTNTTVVTPHLRIPPKLRTNDQAIMEVALRLNFNTAQLSLINNCRLYLQVITIADISTNDGQQIQPIYRRPNHPTTTHQVIMPWSQSIYIWPQQIKPNNKAWRMWTKLMNHLTEATTNNLKKPLGQWIQNNQQPHRRYRYEISPCLTIIKHQHQYFRRTKTLRKQWTYQFTEHNDTSTIPFLPIIPDKVSASEIYVTNFPPKPIICTAPSRPINRKRNANCNAPTTTESTTTGSTNDNTEITTTTSNIVQLTTTPTLITPTEPSLEQQVSQCKNIIIGTHCSHEYERQTFVWAIRIRLQNNNIIPIANSQALFLESRSCEDTRGNYLSILIAVRFLKSNFRLKRNTVFHLCCQTKKITNRLHKSKYEYKTAKNMLSAEKEIIEEIKNELHAIGKFKTIHIPKHDSNASAERDIIDLCAFHVKHSPPTKAPKTMYGKATIFRNKIEVSADIENELRNAASTQDLCEYMQKKYRWTDSDIDEIDWMLHGNALAKLPIRMKKTTIQFLHEWTPVLAHPGQHTHVNTICPVCTHEEETLEHFLTCPKCEEEWELQITSITPSDESNLPIKEIYQLLQWALKYHRSPNATTEPPECLYTQVTREIIRTQQRIGWHHLWKGRWSQAWVRKHNQHTNADGEKWCTDLIVQIWKIQYNQWCKRCEILHEAADESNINPTEANNLETRIKAIYDQHPHLDRIDRQVLHQPIRIVLQMKPRLQKDWIKRTEGFVKIGIKRAKQRIKHSTPSIANYFRIRERQPCERVRLRPPAPTEAANFRPP